MIETGYHLFLKTLCPGRNLALLLTHLNCCIRSYTGLVTNRYGIRDKEIVISHGRFSDGRTDTTSTFNPGILWVPSSPTLEESGIDDPHRPNERVGR